MFQKYNNVSLYDYNAINFSKWMMYQTKLEAIGMAKRHCGLQNIPSCG